MSDTTRTEEPRLTLSTFLGLIPFGLVAAATIVTFSVASFSFLYTSEGTSRVSRYGDRGFEAEPERSGGFPYIHPNPPPVPKETDLPSSAAQAAVSISSDHPAAHLMRLAEVPDLLPPSASEGSTTRDVSLSGTSQTPPTEISLRLPPGVGEGSTTRDASLSGTAQTPPSEISQRSPLGVDEGSAIQDASLSGTAQRRLPEVSRAQSVSEPLLPSGSEGTATQDASLSGTAQTPAPEVIGARPVPEPLLPGVSEESATQGASLSGILPTLPIPAAQRDRIFREFAMHHDQKVSFGSHGKMPTKNMQQGQSHYYSSTNGVFGSYRVRKECGPIQDPALHADCVRSFRTQYPAHYASSTRTH
jgi:hypothetical protein